MRSFSGPESIQAEKSATVGITVGNVGDTDGEFVGALNRSGPAIAYTPVSPVRLDVPAGETVTFEHTNGPDDRHRIRRGDEPRSMRFGLNWRGESVEHTVTVRSAQ